MAWRKRSSGNLWPNVRDMKWWNKGVNFRRIGKAILTEVAIKRQNGHANV